MPVRIQDNLPAVDILKEENIFVMNDSKAEHQDIRPLRIAIVNLMPIKETTETDLIRLLSNTPLQVQLDLVKIEKHKSKNTSQEHIKEFYTDFSKIKAKKYDGLIITGAPVELLPFEEVKYWDEMKEILDWAKCNVTSSLFICWASQAALHHYYGIPKYPLEKKMFGVFPHTIIDSQLPIFRGFDDLYYVPHSRYTEIRREDLEKVPELSIASHSDVSGVNTVIARNGRQIFVAGHSEYSPYTLDNEYKRDVKKGLPIEIPQNYYPNNDPSNAPQVLWRGHANLFFQNWLNYYVYQETPYNIDDIG